MAYTRGFRWLTRRSFIALSGVVVIAVVTFVLTTAWPNHMSDWSQPGGGPHHAGTNLTESGLNPSTVRWLAPKWVAHTGPVKWSPAVVNGVVYTSSSDHQVSAVRSNNGQVLWTHSTGDDEPLAPAAGSGLVYVASGHTLSALDARSGAVRWLKTFPDSITAPALDEDSIYVGGSGRIHALRADTGADRWTSPDLGGVIESAPAVSNGVVYVGTRNGLLYNWGATGHAYALKASDGGKLWSFSATGNSTPIYYSPVVADGVVYVVPDNGQIVALNAKTGAQLWALDGAVTNYPIVVAGSRIYATWSRHAYARDATNGKEIWDTMLPGPGLGAPVLAGGVLYVPYLDGRTGMLALDVNSHNYLWEGTIGQRGISSPVVVDGTLYVGADDGHLYAFASQYGYKPPATR
jgi:outer membrane protein assembly factor BamB